jgi:hypothetical protein
MSTSKKCKAELATYGSRKTVGDVFTEVKNCWRLQNASEKAKPGEVATISTAPSGRTDAEMALS